VAATILLTPNFYQRKPRSDPAPTKFCSSHPGSNTVGAKHGYVSRASRFCKSNVEWQPGVQQLSQWLKEKSCEPEVILNLDDGFGRLFEDLLNLAAGACLAIKLT
jgi:hypothetical protein